MNFHAALFRVAVIAAAQLLTGMPAAAADTKPVINSIGMQLMRIPAGEFIMGSEELPASLAKAYPQLPSERLHKLQDEAPAHRVRISRDFFIGAHEVTRGQFRQFVNASGYVPESIQDGSGAYGYRLGYDPSLTARGDAFEGRDPRYSWLNPGFSQTDAHPVVNITYADALAFAAWLSRLEGRRYRLPTEAEWEYAARAGTRTRYHSGDDPASLLAVANLFDADSAALWPHWLAMALSGSDGYAFTAPVGSFAANAWGLFDMHGNAWEWVSDWHGDDYYAHSPSIDPQGPADGEVRVRRGGSWHTWPFYARVSYRNYNAPSSRYTLLGFRLVREISSADAP
ncbi:MAG: formylglycine-generating enzyme family protein [Paucibacter sp.]|nr:formylglycine-generating enzyme family protein [Roseateles sp.]